MTTHKDEMTPREEFVYKLRSEGVVYKLIGEQLGVSVERIRQIYQKCLKKIQKKASDK